MRSARHSLSRIADAALEVADLEALSQLLTRRLPETLGLASVTLLSWDRKLDSFESLTRDETKRGSLESAPLVNAPDGRYLLSDGALIDTGSDKGEATLVPLLARSGLIGMLVLGRRRGRRRLPYTAAEVRQLGVLARRAALALENHLYQRELIASERLAALGTMAGMLVHDFRGPMTVIRGYAETLNDPGVTRQEIAERTQLIMDMIDRLERMTTETLDFARGGGRLARRTVQLNRLLHALAADLAEELPGIEVVREIEIGTDVEAALDVDKLRRAIGNIAANARDAMGGKGRLHLRAALQELPAGDGAPARPGFVLLLADEGPGVPKEIAERLFDPFVTRGKKGGTGLGLAVARRFVEDHGGSIGLLGEGPGARFRIVLPLQPPPERAEA